MYPISGCGYLSALDASSRRRFRLFAVKLAATGIFAIILCTVNGYPLLGSLACLCAWQSLFVSSIALVPRQNLQVGALG